MSSPSNIVAPLTLSVLLGTLPSCVDSDFDPTPGVPWVSSIATRSMESGLPFVSLQALVESPQGYVGTPVAAEVFCRVRFSKPGLTHWAQCHVEIFTDQGGLAKVAEVRSKQKTMRLPTNVAINADSAWSGRGVLPVVVLGDRYGVSGYRFDFERLVLKRP